MISYVWNSSDLFAGVSIVDSLYHYSLDCPVGAYCKIQSAADFGILGGNGCVCRYVVKSLVPTGENPGCIRCDRRCSRPASVTDRLTEFASTCSYSFASKVKSHSVGIYCEVSSNRVWGLDIGELVACDSTYGHSIHQHI